MKEVSLTNSNLKAIVDDEDFTWVIQWNWQLSESGYAFRCDAHRKPRNVWMHREIHGTAVGMFTDHRNRNRLHNWRSNLRTATKPNNQANAACYRTLKRTSVFKGVCWHKLGRKWLVQLTRFGTRHYLGLFEDEVVAAKVYDEAAKAIFGPFAKLNFPDGSYINGCRS